MPNSKKRILWLHTQPEFYHNLMLDDLAQGTGYRLPGMPDEHPEEFEWIAGFAYRGPGVYSQNALPSAAQTLFLRVRPGKEDRPPRLLERYHIDWRADLRALGTHAGAPLGPDVVIVSGYAQRTFRQIIAACHATGTPVAMWSDSNIRADRRRPPLKRCLKRLFLRRLAASVNLLTTANTRGIAYWRYYAGPDARSRIVLSPCYTSYPRIDTARAQDRAAILARFGISPEDRILFTAARLVPAKGLDLVLRAFSQFHLHQRRWKYLVAGTGPLEAQLKSLAGPLLGQSIHFLGFQQPSDNLALMAAADVMILPSRFEPHGIVLNEALAAGTPIVVSNVVGGAFGLIEHGINGLYFRSEDPADLARQLQQLEDPSRLAALRAAARPSFESWYRRTSPMLIAPRVVRRLLGTEAP